MRKNKDLTVFISNRSSTCDDCQSELGRSAWITLEEGIGALCLSCSDLDHLEFLHSGDAALTRRSKKYSSLWAVVLKWSKARKRYERKGLLVEKSALEQAEQECLDDSEARALRRARAAEKRAELDEKYVQSFAQKVRQLFPNSPKDKEQIIAEHACLKYSGRIGRTGSAKALDDKAIELAVIAHIRHTETNYDQLLVQGNERGNARGQVKQEVIKILEDWKKQS